MFRDVRDECLIICSELAITSVSSERIVSISSYYLCEQLVLHGVANISDESTDHFVATDVVRNCYIDLRIYAWNFQFLCLRRRSASRGIMCAGCSCFCLSCPSVRPCIPNVVNAISWKVLDVSLVIKLSALVHFGRGMNVSSFGAKGQSSRSRWDRTSMA